jgi:hypothetical protein
MLSVFAARAAGDSARLDGSFDALGDALASLSSFLLERKTGWRAFGHRLTTADGSLAAFLFYAQSLAKACDRPVLAPHSRLQTFWDGAQEDPVLSTVIRQMAAAMSARRSRPA